MTKRVGYCRCRRRRNEFRTNSVSTPCYKTLFSGKNYVRPRPTFLNLQSKVQDIVRNGLLFCLWASAWWVWWSIKFCTVHSISSAPSINLATTSWEQIVLGNAEAENQTGAAGWEARRLSIVLCAPGPPGSCLCARRIWSFESNNNIHFSNQWSVFYTSLYRNTTLYRVMDISVDCCHRHLFSSVRRRNFSEGNFYYTGHRFMSWSMTVLSYLVRSSSLENRFSRSSL